MKLKKNDLIPIAAIAVFLVIIIILCAVRISQRNRAEEERYGAAEETVNTLTSERDEKQDEASGTEVGEDGTKEARWSEAPAQNETEAQEEARGTVSGSEAAKNRLPFGKQKEEQESTAQGVRTISGNDPMADADEVNKSNEDMLSEMSYYWEQNNLEAISDLAHLGWYMKMSASLADQDTFYYYGERNAQGQPEGTGIACYADNEYYYGEWVNGRREGVGRWIKFYIYYDDDKVSDRAYTVHMYLGEWAADLPNGDGQEHYDLDMSQAAKEDRYIQNVIGTFRDGMYDGEMYLTTLDWRNRQEEWNGLAEGGVWSPYGAATSRREVPVCQDVSNEDNYLWITVRSNKDRGISELMP